jgi:predicted nucleotide-binding protein
MTTQSHEELFGLAEGLTEAASAGDSEDFMGPVDALQAAAEQVGKSFSGSWLGYHARVYYADLTPPPPGANFSAEWGLMDTVGSYGSVGAWQQFDPGQVMAFIQRLGGNPDLSAARTIAETGRKVADRAKSDMLSILESEMAEGRDGFLEKLKAEIEQSTEVTLSDAIDFLTPRGQVMTRDSLALTQGSVVPPHISAIADLIALRHNIGRCRQLANLAIKAASHLERLSRRKRRAEQVGTNVFIGHGQSRLWRELKDFVSDRLRLPWDEFNRVPVAGFTNIARLSEMLDAAAIGFLVLTAEDEMTDGEVQARMNVVHEAGLFQGRLGFSKAVILLEEGCTEFSNIQGLGQIRFPKGKIAAAFEDVRRVVEREGLIEAL